MGGVDLAGAIFSALCFGTGALLTIVYLRLRAASRTRAQRVLVESGRAAWACQAREIVQRTFGASGEMLVGIDGLLRWTPDEASVKRGAVAESWSLEDAVFSFGRRRLDVSGLHYKVLAVRRPGDGGPPRRFACLSQIGRFPGLQSGRSASGSA